MVCKIKRQEGNVNKIDLGMEHLLDNGTKQEWFSRQDLQLVVLVDWKIQESREDQFGAEQDNAKIQEDMNKHQNL